MGCMLSMREKSRPELSSEQWNKQMHQKLYEFRVDKLGPDIARAERDAVTKRARYHTTQKDLAPIMPLLPKPATTSLRYSVYRKSQLLENWVDDVNRVDDEIDINNACVDVQQNSREFVNHNTYNSNNNDSCCSNNDSKCRKNNSTINNDNSQSSRSNNNDKLIIINTYAEHKNDNRHKNIIEKKEICNRSLSNDNNDNESNEHDNDNNEEGHEDDRQSVSSVEREGSRTFSDVNDVNHIESNISFSNFKIISNNNVELVESKEEKDVNADEVNGCKLVHCNNIINTNNNDSCNISHTNGISNSVEESVIKDVNINLVNEEIREEEENDCNKINSIIISNSNGSNNLKCDADNIEIQKAKHSLGNILDCCNATINNDEVKVEVCLSRLIECEEEQQQQQQQNQESQEQEEELERERSCNICTCAEHSTVEQNKTKLEHRTNVLDDHCCEECKKLKKVNVSEIAITNTTTTTTTSIVNHQKCTFNNTLASPTHINCNNKKQRTFAKEKHPRIVFEPPIVFLEPRWCKYSVDIKKANNCYTMEHKPREKVLPAAAAAAAMNVNANESTEKNDNIASSRNDNIHTNINTHDDKQNNYHVKSERETLKLVNNKNTSLENGSNSNNKKNIDNNKVTPLHSWYIESPSTEWICAKIRNTEPQSLKSVLRHRC